MGGDAGTFADVPYPDIAPVDEPSTGLLRIFVGLAVQVAQL
jgi:hypothetical protein